MFHIKKESVLEILKTFLESTSVRGVPRTVKSSTLFLRVLWMVAVAAAAGAGTYMVCRLVGSYAGKKIVTSITQIQKGAPFPDITLCNLNPLSNIPDGNIYYRNHINRVRNVFKDINPNEIEKMLFADLLTIHGLYQNLNIDDLIQQVRSEDFVRTCKWFTRDLQEVGTVNCSQKGHPIFLTAEFGYCMTFKADDISSKSNEEMDILGFSAVLFLNRAVDIAVPEYELSLVNPFASGVRVILHAPGTIPNVHEGVNLSPGYHTSVRLKITKREQLPYPYTDCEYKETLELTHSEAENISYSVSACENLCTQEASENQCSCLSGLFFTTSTMRDQKPFCGKLLPDVRLSAQRFKCSKKLDTAQHCSCPIPCGEYHYELHTSNAPWPIPISQLAFYNTYVKGWYHSDEFIVYEDIKKLMNTDEKSAFNKLRGTDVIQRHFLQVNVLLDNPLVTLYTDTAATSIEQLVGSVGGTLNLWIGVTFIFVVEIVELLYHLMMLCFEKKDLPTENKNPAERISTEISQRGNNNGCISQFGVIEKTVYSIDNASL